MRSQTFLPAIPLRAYIEKYEIIEEDDFLTYKVLPGLSVVLGFQYRGSISKIENGKQEQLSTAGITGLADRFKMFSTASPVGSVLVYLRATGLAAFSRTPANELFNRSVALDHFFRPATITEVRERMYETSRDEDRINLLNQLFISHLIEGAEDFLIKEAVNRLIKTQGQIRMHDLQHQLCISASPFEKRFRTIVGTSAKKFASLVRFQSVLKSINHHSMLKDLGYDYSYYDQAHFTKDFKQFSGLTPKEWLEK